MDNIKYNYFLSNLDDDLLLIAECIENNIYYSVHFLIRNNKFEVKYISTTKDKKGTVEYKYKDCSSIINDNNIEINLDYVFLFDDSIEIPFKLNKIFKKTEIYDSKYDQFDELDDVVVIKYIEDLVSSKQLYRNNKFIYDNCEKIFRLIQLIEKRNIDFGSFNLNTKMMFEDVLKNVREFFERNNININLDKLINEKTIIFIDSDDKNLHGTSYLAVLIHEIMHYYNQPENDERTFSSEYLTEVVSYSCELIAIDKFINSEYKDDVNKIIKNTFYSMVSCAWFMYSSILSLCIFKNNGCITKDEIEKSINFDRYKNEMSNYIKERHNLSKDLWNLIGYYLAIYNYVEYKKDNNHLNKVLLLNDSINDEELLECLKIIDINSMDEIASKGLNALDEYIEMFQEEKQNKKALN